MVSRRTHSSSTEDRRSPSTEQSDTTPRDTTSPLERRSVLKLLGLSAIPLGIGCAAADESGYGSGAYGYGGYGEPEDEVLLEVATESATDVTVSEATLTGTLAALGTADAAECSFEWRAAGTSAWTETDGQSLSSSGSFEHTVSGLTADTEYEFRAVAKTADDGVTGEIRTVTTDQDVPLENTILLDGIGTSGGSTYEFTVSGEVEPSTYKGATISDDEIDGGHVTGSVAGWRDAFRFSGDLESLTVDGQARAYLNDELVDPAVYGGEQSSVLTIIGNTVASEYEITVDGTIEILDDDGDDLTVSDGSAEGTIQRSVHRFQFTGDLVEFTFHDGGTHVYLDDQRIDPDDYNGETETLPHAIVFDGTDAAEPSQYAFTVDGDVDTSTYRNATIDEDDVIEGTSVRGEVAGGAVDAYWFDGEIDDFWLTGDATVNVEYNAR